MLPRKNTDDKHIESNNTTAIAFAVIATAAAADAAGIGTVARVFGPEVRKASQMPEHLSKCNCRQLFLAVFTATNTRQSSHQREFEL